MNQFRKIFRSLKFRVPATVLLGFLLLSTVLIQYGFSAARDTMLQERKTQIREATESAHNEIAYTFQRIREAKLTKKEAQAEVIRRLSGPLLSISLNMNAKTAPLKIRELLRKAGGGKYAGLKLQELGAVTNKNGRLSVKITDPTKRQLIYDYYAALPRPFQNLLEEDYGIYVFRDVSKTSVKPGKSGYMYVVRSYRPQWLIPGTGYPEDYSREKIAKRFAANFQGLPMKREVYLTRFGDTAEKQWKYIRSYMSARRSIPHDVQLISHPALGFRNVANLLSNDGKRIGRELAAGVEGEYSYTWKNPGESRPYKKIAYYKRIQYRDAAGTLDPTLEWVITAGAYENEAYASIVSLRRELYIISACISLAFLVLMFLGMQLALFRPLQRLISAIKQVDSGDLNVNISSKASNEIGYLSNSFNNMVASIKLNQHELREVNASYARFVPQEFLGFLKRSNIMDVSLGDQIQKDMTILFVDIRSFTRLSEAMTPPENFNFLNEYLKSVGPVIRDHGGFIDKYIGDAVMAIFPGKVTEALDAAVQIRSRLERFNAGRKARGEEPIKIGIGIHRGSLMLGTVGEEQRMESTVISDAVNLASRIEGLTKSMGVTIAVSEKTLQEVEQQDKYNHRFLGVIRVKGKQERVSVYEIYDGDQASDFTAKKNSSRIFEFGIRDYINKNYETAILNFHRVLEINPEDRAATLYLRRCRNLMERNSLNQVN